MKVADILEKKGVRIHTVSPDSTLWEASRDLCERRIGALVVTDREGKMVGIFTERDFVCECAVRPDEMRRTKVADVMTRDVVTCHAGDDLRSVERLMHDHAFRHLVVTEGEHLVGVISIRDVLAGLYEYARDDANQLRDTLVEHYVVC